MKLIKKKLGELARPSEGSNTPSFVFFVVAQLIATVKPSFGVEEKL
jgi:hypothetical protein